MDHVDRGHHFEQFAGDMDRRADAARSIADLAGIGLHIADELGNAAQQIALYSITSSARASTVAGMSMRSDFAVFRLIKRSNFVGNITGMSAGFSPFTMRPT